MEKWFICKEEKVTGPFSTDEIKAQYTSAQIPAGSLIWGRSLTQWQTIEWWTSESSKSSLSATAATVTSMTSSSGSASDAASNQQTWHYALDGASKGPLTRVELINELRSIKNSTEILVWTKGMKTWADLYDFEDLVNELGLNKREHPRVNITGNVVVKTEDKTYIGQLKSISLGGFGAAQMNNSLSIGQSFSVELKSDHLGDSVTAKAIVQYITDQGYYGCKFQTINMESRARITEYILRVKQATGAAA